MNQFDLEFELVFEPDCGIANEVAESRRKASRARKWQPRKEIQYSRRTKHSRRTNHAHRDIREY